MAEYIYSMVRARKAVGDKLNAEGVKSAICVDQQQGAVQLEERCDGIKKTFHGNLFVLYVPGYDMATGLGTPIASNLLPAIAKPGNG